jgi:hypothetical protein
MKQVTITLKNYANDQRNPANDAPAIQDVCVEPLTEGGRKWIKKVSNKPSLYDVQDLEWFAEVNKAIRIVSAKTVSYSY